MTKNTSKKSFSLRHSITALAGISILLVSLVLISYSEIYSRAQQLRLGAELHELRSDLLMVALDLQHGRLMDLVRAVSVDDDIIMALVNGETDKLDDAMRNIRDSWPELPQMGLFDNSGIPLVQIGNLPISRFDGQVHGEERIVLDFTGMPSIFHSKTIRRGVESIGTIKASLPIVDTVQRFFPDLEGLAYFSQYFNSGVIMLGKPEDFSELEYADLVNTREKILSTSSSRFLEASVIGLESVDGNLVFLHNVSEALALQNLLRLLALSCVGFVTMFSIGLFLHRLRIGFRPLGAIVKLLGVMAGNDKSSADQDGSHAHSSTGSYREINILLGAVDSFRNSIDAQNAYIAISEQIENASRIQQSLLPATLDLDSSIDLFGHMRPAQEVAGDFFDAFGLPDGRIVVLVADVAGKGLAPSLFASQASALIRLQCQHSDYLPQIMSAVNFALCERNPESMFLTAFIAIINPDSDRVNCINAGHSQPIVARADGSMNIIKMEPNIVLGAFPDVDFVSGHFDLSVGDKLLLYSDGFDEAMNEGGELLGLERAMVIAQRVFEKKLSSKAFTYQIFEEIDKFAGEADQADDISIVVLRKREYSLDKADEST
ncbi:MAG: PP2C family protein-serine/threonine phosphatase [Gammaproteobacteria bacterium]|nr:PP2C family protein-serine/threonine phosphatase [Gammaproteobacteria bacterium]MCY4228900.1 PP2C family protein-serine/threonine phosphatase [Gammaproteobacteria bacterium]